jgi:predicted RNA-binding protein with PUA-like domain
MRFWVVKGRPSRNDLREMLAPGRVEQWVTRRPPRAWEPGDAVFVWEAAPRLRVVGLAQVKKVHTPNGDGETFFDLTYLTGVFDAPLTLEALRGDAEMAAASFLKAGAAGTVFPLTTKQADRLLRLAKEGNVSARGVEWGAEPAQTEVELPTRDSSQLGEPGSAAITTLSGLPFHSDTPSSSVSSARGWHGRSGSRAFNKSPHSGLVQRSRASEIVVRSWAVSRIVGTPGRGGTLLPLDFGARARR